VGDLDQSLKRLIQMRPQDWLAFALRDTPVEYLGIAQIDLATEPPMQVDSFLRVRYQGAECLVDIEAQAEADTTMGWRLYKYAGRASAIFDLPVISVVLWLERHGRIPTSTHEIRMGDWLSGTWSYKSIEVYRLQAAELLALGEHGALGLLPLVPLTQDGGALEATEDAGRILQAQTSGEELASLATLLGILASRHIDRDLADMLVRRLVMSNELLETSPLYQKWAHDWLEQGLEQGRIEGERESVRRFLQARFGALSTELELAITQADRSALDAVLPHMGDESPEQLLARLTGAAPQN